MADDWDKVTVIRKSKPSSKDLKSAAVINKAMASGQVEIIKKGKCMRWKPYPINNTLLLFNPTHFFVEKHGENAAHLAKIENSDDVKGKKYLQSRIALNLFQLQIHFNFISLSICLSDWLF